MNLEKSGAKEEGYSDEERTPPEHNSILKLGQLIPTNLAN